jgi:hypothetical protein
MAEVSDKKLLAAAVLLVVGRMLLTGSFFFLAAYFSFDVPRNPIRVVCFLLLGIFLAAGGHRLAADSWGGFSQVPHQSAAYAGIGFIALTARYALAGKHHIQFYPEGFVALVSGLLIISWLVRGKYWAHGRKRGVKS